MNGSIVLFRSFYSPALGREKKYGLYLPPSYRASEDIRFSTLYLLPGLMDYERTWTDKGRVHEHMDRLLEDNKIGEMILVMPDKDDAALDQNNTGPFATYLGRDLIGHIDAEYRTIPVRAHRGIEGLSLGAGWAIRMALSFPELFCSVGSLSGGFGDESYQALYVRQKVLKELGTRFRVGVGLGEPEYMPNNTRFVQYLRELGFYCELDMMDGPHDWPLWQKQVIHSLQFHYYSFNPVE